MSISDLATFCDSPSGRIYAKVCERWGVDPAAIVDDEVLAINLRAGLAYVLDKPEPKTVAESHRDLVDRAREGAARVSQELAHG